MTDATRARQTVAALVERAERQLDNAFAPAARHLGEAARQIAGEGGPLTREQARAMKQASDAIHDRLWGRRRGAPNVTVVIMATGADAAYVAPWALEAARVAKTLIDREETALLAAMMRGGNDGP